MEVTGEDMSTGRQISSTTCVIVHYRHTRVCL